MTPPAATDADAQIAHLLKLLDRPGTRAHFVGVGGAGMAPLAAIALDRGWRVSGCDKSPSTITDALATRGLSFQVGHAADHSADQELVVASSAVPNDEPELRAARAAGAAVVKRAELVGALTRRSRAICIAGTHGKTTTTSMTAVALVAAGADPSALVGAAVPGLGVGGRSGRGPWLVVESDEFDGSFLRFRPEIAVVTNVEADHLDYYRDLEAIDEAFRRFLALIGPEGRAIVCADDPGALRVAPPGAITYALDADARWRARDMRPNRRGGHDFSVEGVPVSLAVPGRHNVQNALAALAVCGEIGVDLAAAAEGLAEFRGAARRFEPKGEVGGVAVYDDYSHHPTEVRVALAAARQRAIGRVWCLFQPHTYHRTAALFDDFVHAFAEADRVLMLDVYSPAGREPLIADVSSDRLVAAMPHPNARHARSFDEAAAIVADEAREGDLVLTMGAGDVTRLAPIVLERLDARGA